MRSRLHATWSGVHQFSARPSASSPPSLSIFGPSAPRYTGVLGGGSIASDTLSSLAAAPSCVTVSPARRLLTTPRYSRITSSVEPGPIPKARLPDDLCSAPEPMPRTNRPPVSAVIVPALIARLVGVRSATGDTEMPVPRPPSTTARLAAHLWAHTRKES